MSLDILKNYIRQIIKEDLSREDLAFTKDPVDWVDAAWKNPELFGKSNEFLTMQHAVEHLGLNMLGRGSSRIVYDMGDGKWVLKIALNKKGIAQNELESFAGSDPYVDKIVAKVKENSDEYAWVVSQRVEQLYSEKDFEDAVGVTWNELRNALGLKTTQDLDSTAKPSRASTKRQGLLDSRCLRGQAFLDYVKNYVARYEGMLPGDLAKYDSWGTTSDGCIVLLDYGITRKKFDQLYKNP
jgi:hypothetical protein